MLYMDVFTSSVSGAELTYRHKTAREEDSLSLNPRSRDRSRSIFIGPEGAEQGSLNDLGKNHTHACRFPSGLCSSPGQTLTDTKTECLRTDSSSERSLTVEKDRKASSPLGVHAVSLCGHASIARPASVVIPRSLRFWTCCKPDSHLMCEGAIIYPVQSFPK